MREREIQREGGGSCIASNGTPLCQINESYCRLCHKRPMLFLVSSSTPLPCAHWGPLLSVSLRHPTVNPFLPFTMLRATLSLLSLPHHFQHINYFFSVSMPPIWNKQTLRVMPLKTLISITSDFRHSCCLRHWTQRYILQIIHIAPHIDIYSYMYPCCVTPS